MPWCEQGMDLGGCFARCSIPCSPKQDREQGFSLVDKHCSLPPLPALAPTSVAQAPSARSTAALQGANEQPWPRFQEGH